jgi:hypothetical protein
VVAASLDEEDGLLVVHRALVIKLRAVAVEQLDGLGGPLPAVKQLGQVLNGGEAVLAALVDLLAEAGFGRDQVFGPLRPLGAGVRTVAPG